MDRARPQALTAGALPPVEAAEVSPIAPGLETPPAAEGQSALTFRRREGGAMLEISLRREGVWPRLGALVLLVAVPAVWWWRRRRAAQAG